MLLHIRLGLSVPLSGDLPSQIRRSNGGGGSVERRGAGTSCSRSHEQGQTSARTVEAEDPELRWGRRRPASPAVSLWHLHSLAAGADPHKQSRSSSVGRNGGRGGPAGIGGIAASAVIGGNAGIFCAWREGGGDGAKAVTCLGRRGCGGGASASNTSRVGYADVCSVRSACDQRRRLLCRGLAASARELRRRLGLQAFVSSCRSTDSEPGDSIMPSLVDWA